MSIFLSTLFMILLLRNLIETLIPDGKVSRVAKQTVRLLCFVWILSAVGALVQSRTIAEAIEGVSGVIEEQSMETSGTAVWIQNEYEKVLMDAAEQPLRDKGMVIRDIDVATDPEGNIQAVNAELQSKALKDTLVEIQIEDITIQDPAVPQHEEYQMLLSKIWGIPAEAIYLHISE